MMMNKKGVSLITVLLFMLVATIAATATFKWLSSENRSSGSRLWQNEARMAAIAGIESARSWITHHGNETGAVIKQYLEKKTPISLDGQLVAVGNTMQSYSVSVADVDVSEMPYKVKIVSEGKSRNGTKHSETAIFKINGLYRVSQPTQPATSDYDYAYFGGTTNFDGGHKATSMLINGNWSGNPGNVSKDFIVTGTTTLSGDNITVGGTSCLGGATSVQNGFITRDLFVDGKLSSFNGTITGDAYFNKDVSFGSVSNKSTSNGNYGGFRVGGSMTLNGSMVTDQPTFDYNIGKNMCLGNTDAAKLTFKHSPKKFIVEQDVWVPKRTAMSGIRNFGVYNKVVLGNRTNSNVYVEKYKKCTDDDVVSYKIGAAPDLNLDLHRKTDHGSEFQFSNCPSDMYYQKGDEGNFKEYNGYGTSLAYVEKYAQFMTRSTNLTREVSSLSEQMVTCAEPVKEYCDNIWEKKKGCSAESQYFVPDMLTTSYANFKTFAAKSSCSKNITTLSNQSVLDMNACYKSLKSDPSKKDKELFNGYLVLNLQPDFNAANGITNVLDGKFIFVYDDQLGQFALPMTTSTSSVFLYLKEGASSTIDCKCPEDGKNCKTEAYHNYFIFANKSLAGLLGACKYSGSMYAVAENCAGIGSVNGTVELEYNPTVVNDLTASGVICKAGSSCTGTVTTSVSSSSSGSGSAGVVPDYIAVGTNLTVELESQYKTTETVAQSTPVEPSVVVLPRVVYLNDNAEGALKDYFAPASLNGASLSGDGQLSCPSYTGLTSSTLVTESNPLSQGVYTCTYTNSSGQQQYSSDFFVVVGGSANSIPNIGFVGNSSVPLSATGDMTTDIYLNVGAVKNGAGEFSVDIVLTGNTDWNITSHIGNAVSTSTGEVRYHYEGQRSSTASDIKLFTVVTTANSAQGDLWFMLENPEDCIPVNPVKVLSIRGETYITRKSISEFCSAYSDDAYCQDKEYCEGRNDCDGLSDFDEIPSCEDIISKNFGSDYEWVRAFGDDCSVSSPAATNTNKKWSCYTGSAINLVLRNGSSLSEYCDFYLPNSVNNEITTFSGDLNKVLYAETKRKPKKLTVNLEDHGTGSASIYVSTTAFSSLNDLNNAISSGLISSSNIHSCTNSQCIIDVYAGDHVYLRGNSASGSNPSTFSVWKHYEGSPSELVSNEGNPTHVLVDRDTVIYGYFNQRDKHCFYDDLQSVSVWCDDNSCPNDKNACNCVDKCTSENHCSVTEGHKYEAANWVTVYSNAKTTTYNYMAPPTVSDSWKKLGTREGLVDGLWSGEDAENERDGDESVVLGYAESGSNGSFTASFKTGNIKESDQTHYLNSGFIFRSDAAANKYLTLSVYGRNLTGLDVAAVGVFARVCYNEGKTLTSKNSCLEKELKSSHNLSIALVYGSTISMEANIQGNTLDVKFSYQYGTAATWDASGVSFDLKDPHLNPLNATEKERDTYKYVGLKLSDKRFKVISAAWRSYDYNECWDTPFTTCSFAENYAGGRVPLKQNVMPWVGISNWFSEKNCTIKYFYNGCDMNPTPDRYESGLNTWLNSVAAGVSGASCPADDPSADGYYWGTADGGKNGAALKSDKTYNFTYEGLHGEIKATPASITYPAEGYVRNASVLVDCEGVARNYVANCGTFWVGAIHECTTSETLLQQYNNGFGDFGYIEVGGVYGGYGYGYAPTTPFPYYWNAAYSPAGIQYNPKNLRSATIQMDIAFGKENQVLTVYLKDSDGNDSRSIELSSAKKSFNVNEVINATNFNPESVVGMVFVSDDYYKITSIVSACDNAPTASCSDAFYNAERKELTLYGSATNGDRCELQFCDDPGPRCKKAVSCLASPFIATDVKPGEHIVQNKEYDVKLRVIKGSGPANEEVAVCNPFVTKVLYGDEAGSGSGTTTLNKTATCQTTTLSNGSVRYRVTAQNCNADECPVVVKKGDATTSYGANSMSGWFEETIDVSGTYYVYFNGGTTALTGCNGFVVDKSESAECECASTCGDLCNNIQVGSNVGVEGTSHSAQCFFGTSVEAINRNYDKNTIVINGMNYPDNKPCDNPNDCSANIKDFPVKNGGYFMLVPKSAGNVVDGNYYEWIKARVTGASAVPAACRTSTDPSDEELLSEQTVSITKGSEQIERGGFENRGMIDLKSGEILSVDKTTNGIAIGCWGEQGTRFLKVQDCSNVVSNHTIYCGNWNDLGISEKCTLYIQADGNDINFKFGAWGY